MEMDKRKICQFFSLLDLFISILGVVIMLLLLRILFVFSVAMPDDEVILRSQGIDSCIYHSLKSAAFNVSGQGHHDTRRTSHSQEPVTMDSLVEKVGWMFIAYWCFVIIFTITLIANIYGAWKLFRASELGVNPRDAVIFIRPWRMIIYALLVLQIIFCVIEKTLLIGFVSFGLRMLAMYFVDNFVKELSGHLKNTYTAESLLGDLENGNLGPRTLRSPTPPGKDTDTPKIYPSLTQKVIESPKIYSSPVEQKANESPKSSPTEIDEDSPKKTLVKSENDTEEAKI